MRMSFWLVRPGTALWLYYKAVEHNHDHHNHHYHHDHQEINEVEHLVYEASLCPRVEAQGGRRGFQLGRRTFSIGITNFITISIITASSNIIIRRGSQLGRRTFGITITITIIMASSSAAA